MSRGKSSIRWLPAIMACGLIAIWLLWPTPDFFAIGQAGAAYLVLCGTVALVLKKRRKR